MRRVVLFQKTFSAGLVCISLNSRPSSSHRAFKKKQRQLCRRMWLRFDSCKRSFAFDLFSRSSEVISLIESTRILLV